MNVRNLLECLSLEALPAYLMFRLDWKEKAFKGQTL
jgi:hypothetical protein